MTLKGIEEKEKVLKYFKDKNHITQKEQDSQIIIILYMIIYMCFIYSCIVSNYTWYEKAVKWYLQSVEEKTVKLKFYNERNYYLNVRLKWRYSGAYINYLIVTTTKDLLWKTPERCIPARSEINLGEAIISRKRGKWVTNKHRMHIILSKNDYLKKLTMILDHKGFIIKFQRINLNGLNYEEFGNQK